MVSWFSWPTESGVLANKGDSLRGLSALVKTSATGGPIDRHPVERYSGVMKVELSEESRRYVAAQLAAGRYRTPTELIADLVRRQKEQDAAARRLWKRQRRALEALLGQMAALPEPAREDGRSNRDHDQVLYGDRA